jgi:transcriptional regulator with XRE-family HTH domain
MSPRRRADPLSPAARAALARMAVDAGQQLRDERLRRGWTLRELATRAGTAITVAHRVEAGDVATLESYARLAAALGMRPQLALTDPRARTGARPHDGADLVHAAMGEVEARALAGPGRTISIDEPYQHYQFAGRADVVAWDDENLLHTSRTAHASRISRRPPAPGMPSAATWRRRSRNVPAVPATGAA